MFVVANMSTRIPRASDLGLSLHDILLRAREVADATSDNALSKAMGVGRSSISTWRKADTLPFEALFSLASSKGISMDWLLTGMGERCVSSAVQSIQELRLREYLGDTKAAKELEQHSKSALKLNAVRLSRANERVAEALSSARLEPNTLQKSALLTVAYIDDVRVDHLVLLAEAMKPKP